MWRNRRLQPSTAFSRLPPVHRVGLEGRLRRRVSDAGPLRDGRAGCGAGVRKPPKEETAGRLGAGWAGAPYGDFGVTDQALVALRELVTRIVRGGREDGEPF